MDKTESTVRNMLTAIEAPLYDVGVLSDRGMLPRLELWRRRGDGLSDSIVARNRPCILPPALRLTLLVSELALATRAMKENR